MLFVVAVACVGGAFGQSLLLENGSATDKHQPSAVTVSFSPCNISESNISRIELTLPLPTVYLDGVRNPHPSTSPTDELQFRLGPGTGRAQSRQETKYE